MTEINEYLLQNEVLIRLLAFICVFAMVAVAEWLAPRRRLMVSRSVRWLNNLGLAFFNSLILRLLFPVAAVGLAAFCHKQGWGILNAYSFPPLFSVCISVLIMDFVIYLQHVMVHAVPLFWRFHRVHHADLDYDVTTGSRFHPVEMVFSMLIKFATIIIIGAPVSAVIIFEILLNATAMFNHGNIRLPKVLDKYLRLIVVTPDMHRVHHSIEKDEMNSNYGFNLPWWDYFFATYHCQPRAGHEKMSIGIRTFREPKQTLWLSGMLMMPFIADSETDPVSKPFHEKAQADSVTMKRHHEKK